MTNVTIRPATEADLASMSAIHYAALARYHEFYAAFFTAHPRDILPVSISRAFQRPETWFLVAEDEETGRLVGFVRWKVVDRGGPLRTGGGGDGGDNGGVAPLFRPKKHLEGIWKRFCVKDGEMEGCYREAAGQERHFYVEHLMIDPAHQKQGIGRLLLSTVLDKARREKVATFLVSSAESFGLYTALGFVDLGRSVVDNGFWMSEVERREEEMGILQEGESERGKMYEGVWELENVMVKRS